MREVISAFLIFPSQLNYHHAIAQNRHQTKNSPEPARRAREQHSNQTPAEQVLWERLRGNRLNGWHFRRQQIIGGYIVDFYCPRAGLAVELDGGIHDSQREYDADRDRTLAEYGVRVLRFQNHEVIADLPGVLEKINTFCGETK